MGCSFLPSHLIAKFRDFCPAPLFRYLNGSKVVPRSIDWGFGKDHPNLLCANGKLITDLQQKLMTWMNYAAEWFDNEKPEYNTNSIPRRQKTRNN